MRLILIVLLSALLAPVACDDDGGGSGGNGDLDPIECPDPTAAGDPCDGRSCFTACGTPVAIEPAPSYRGLTASEWPQVRPHNARRVAFALVSATLTDVQIRHGETADLQARVPLPDVPTDLANVAGLFFAGTGNGLIYPIVANDPTAPIALATWRAAAPIRLIDAENTRLLLQTADGISLVDVNNPANPVEDRCLMVPTDNGMADVWDVEAGPHFVVAAGGDPPGAFVFDLLRPNQPPARLPIDQETTTHIHEETLLVSHAGRAVQYSLVPGQPATQRHTASVAVPWDPPVAGGFLMFGTTAIDLENALKTYDVVSEDGCTVSLNATDLSESWVVAPDFVPNRRFDVMNFPTYDCPPKRSRFGLTDSGAAEPGGGGVLVATDQGVSLYQPDSNTTQVDGVAINGSPAWVGDWVLGVQKYGADFGFNLTADIGWAAEGTPTVPGGNASLATNLVSWSAGPTDLWLITEAAPRKYGESPPDPATNRLQRHTPPATAPVDVVLEDGAQPVAVAASANRVYVFDARRRVRVLDPNNGDELAAPAAPRGFETDAVAASSQGVFFRDTCGVLTWVDPDGVLRALQGDDTMWTPRAADAQNLYAEGAASPHPDLRGAPVLIAARPIAGVDGSFSLTESGRYPLPSLGATVALPAGGVAVFKNGLHVLARP